MSTYANDPRVEQIAVDLFAVHTADRGTWHVSRDGYHQWWSDPARDNPLLETMSDADIDRLAHDGYGPLPTADDAIRHLIGGSR